MEQGAAHQFGVTKHETYQDEGAKAAPIDEGRCKIERPQQCGRVVGLLVDRGGPTPGCPALREFPRRSYETMVLSRASVSGTEVHKLASPEAPEMNRTDGPCPRRS